MKRFGYILIALMLIVVLGGCLEQPITTESKAEPTNSGPSSSILPSSTTPTSSVITDDCSKGHAFPDDADVCFRCGVGYFTATLEFTLGDTGDHYIVSGMGSCTRSKVVIPESYDGLPVTQIGDNAFYYLWNEENGVSYCPEIEEIILPSSITRIGESAFACCVRLKKISLPDGVTELGAGAFGECYALTELRIPDSVVSIGVGLFEYCESLESICLPSGITEIPNIFAMHCVKLKTVVCKGNIQHVGQEAFWACRSLEAVDLGGDLLSAGDYAFLNCSSLKTLDLGNKLEVIPCGMFLGCDSLETIILPETVKSIGDRAFEGCTLLRQITIPETLESLGTDAFAECNPGNFTLYKGMGYVGNQINPYLILVGRVDKAEKNVVMHDDTRFLVSYAFYKSDVESIYFGKSFGDIGYRALRGMDALAKIEVAPENSKYHAAGNCLIETGTKTVVQGCYTSVIPDDGSVTDIGPNSFAELDNIVAFNVPDSITCIKWHVFTDCKNLKVLVIGSGVRSIGAYILPELKYPEATKVFYKGSEADWKKITISGRDIKGLLHGNPTLLKESIIYFYSETAPTGEGNYWHYVDGKPTPWPVSLPTTE